MPLPVFRALVLLGLLAGIGCFGAFAWTRDRRWLRRGLRVVGGSLAAAFVFFAVLIAERLLAP